MYTGVEQFNANFKEVYGKQNVPSTEKAAYLYWFLQGASEETVYTPDWDMTGETDIEYMLACLSCASNGDTIMLNGEQLKVLLGSVKTTEETDGTREV